MRTRLLLGVAVGSVAIAGAAAVWLIRRRRELAGKVRRAALPPASPAAEPAAQASDEPLARQTRFDEHLDEEEQRRHAAARRLRAELEGETP